VESADASEFTWRVTSDGESISSGTLDSGVDLVTPGAMVVDGGARDVRVTLPTIANIVSQTSATVHAYYRFSDASGNPQDSSGNGYHLTASGTFVDAYQVPSLFDGDANTALRLTRNATGAVTRTGGALATALTGGAWSALMAFQRNSPFNNATILRFDDGTDGLRINLDGSGRLRLFRVATGTTLPVSVSLAAGRRYLLEFSVSYTPGIDVACNVWDAEAQSSAGAFFVAGLGAAPVAANTVIGPAIISGTGSGTLVIDELLMMQGVLSEPNQRAVNDLYRSIMFGSAGASSFGNLANLNGWPRLNPGTNTVTIEAGDTATTGTMTVTHRNARI